MEHKTKGFLKIPLNSLVKPECLRMELNRFLRRFRSDLTRSLLYLKDE